MIIDPDRNGCTIWEGNNVQYIRDNAQDCAKKIIEYVTYPIEDGTRSQWNFNILLDTTAIGYIYADLFKQHGIKFEKVSAGKIL